MLFRSIPRRSTSPSSGHGLFGALAAFLFLGIIGLVVFLLISSIFSLGTSRKKLESPGIAALKSDIPASAPPISEEPHADLKIDHSFLGKLCQYGKGKIVTLSDPFTLAAYDRPIDFKVKERTAYTHSTFNLTHLELENHEDGEPLQLHLFAKEVSGDFALFLGTIDHEGTNETLHSREWSHLDEREDEFANSFSSVFPADDEHPEITVTFSQFEFGGFYDVKSSRAKEPVSLCEYFPADAPDDFEWKHAIVTWQRDWISCFYCIEIHEGNVRLY